jgi:hypothetical protein
MRPGTTGKTIMIALTDEGNITKSSNAYICAPDWLEALKNDTFIPVKVGSQSTHNEWLYQKYFTFKFDADSLRMRFQMWKEGEPEKARFKEIRFGDGYSGELITYVMKKDYGNKKELSRYHRGIAN